MRKKAFFVLPILFGVVGTASAQTTFKSLVSTLIGTVFNSLITLAMVIATAAFTFGIYTYVMGARSGDSKQIAKGNQFILWAGITLFVMASIWGIIAFGQGVFGIRSTISIPGASAFNVTAPNSSAVRIGQPAAASQAQGGATGFGSTAFNNGCDPQDPTCGQGVGTPSSSSAFNNGCDPLDASCGQETGTSAAASSAFNNGCDPQDPTCGQAEPSSASAAPSPSAGPYDPTQDPAMTCIRGSSITETKYYCNPKEEGSSAGSWSCIQKPGEKIVCTRQQ